MALSDFHPPFSNPRQRSSPAARVGAPASPQMSRADSLTAIVSPMPKAAPKPSFNIFARIRQALGGK